MKDVQGFKSFRGLNHLLFTTRYYFGPLNSQRSGDCMIKNKLKRQNFIAICFYICHSELPIFIRFIVHLNYHFALHQTHLQRDAWKDDRFSSRLFWFWGNMLQTSSWHSKQTWWPEQTSSWLWRWFWRQRQTRETAFWFQCPPPEWTIVSRRRIRKYFQSCPDRLPTELSKKSGPRTLG